MDDDSSRMDLTRFFTEGGSASPSVPRHDSADLSRRYLEIINRDDVSWEMTYQLISRLGAGGQGVVFLGERVGAFDVSFQLALKFYCPAGYPDVATYRSEMARLSRVANDVARIQQDHLLDVYNVTEHEGILVLVTEWVDGYDLRRLVAPDMLKRVRRSVNRERWEYINDVIITSQGFQSRLMPGVAIAILRECLAGLAALHREGIIHADIKPANVMIKQTGNCKIIDLGSAFSLDQKPLRPTWTARYAAIEVLQGARHTPASDLASLGYVLMELLTGRYPFAGVNDPQELIQLKREMWRRIPELLPHDLARNGTLVSMLSRMIAPDPADRFSSMEEADLSENGAAEIERQLVKVNMTTEAENEMRLLMQEIAIGRISA